MVIKTEVTPEEHALIRERAKGEGKSIKAYLRDRALGTAEPMEVLHVLMEYIEKQADIAQRMNEIATSVVRNKVVYEAEVLELLDRMAMLEATTGDFLKEVSCYGYT